MTSSLQQDARGQVQPGSLGDAAAVASQSKPDAAAIRAWLLRYLSELLHLPAAQISTGDPLAEYGLDSSGAAGLSADLGRWLGLELEADLVYEHPTIDALAAHLAAEVERA